MFGCENGAERFSMFGPGTQTESLSHLQDTCFICLDCVPANTPQQRAFLFNEGQKHKNEASIGNLQNYTSYIGQRRHSSRTPRTHTF